MEHLEGCGCLSWCLFWCGVRVGPILDTRKSDWNCKTVMMDCEMCLQEPGLKFSLGGHAWCVCSGGGSW